MSEIIIYTDGSSDNNGSRCGGYGAVLQYGEHVKEVWGGETDTTNNRMEMLSIIKALETLKRKDLKVKIHSDSAYVVNCFKDKWYVSWRKNGWKNSQKKPVENRDLWERLLELNDEFNIEFVKVKSHIGIELNERADRLADKGRREVEATHMV